MVIFCLKGKENTKDNPNETLQLGLYRRDTTTGSTSRYPRLSGLPNSDCQWQLLQFTSFGYRQILIGDNSNFSCQSIKGLFSISGNDNIVGKYTQMKVPDGDYADRDDRTFIGKRIK